MKKITSILASLIAPEHSWKVLFFTHWPAIIGKLEGVVKIEKIEGATLFLTVSHPTWAQEISLLTPVLLEKIHQYMPSQPITAIRCAFKTQQAGGPIKARITRTPSPAIAATAQLSAQEEKVIASLSDNELQSTLAEYFKRCKALKGRSRL
jgi:hypothetical protein